VQDTNQVAVGGALYYTFGKFMTLGGGWNAYPGTMSLQGSHPYWESYDRVMADEFFRPYFSQGVFALGRYRKMTRKSDPLKEPQGCGKDGGLEARLGKRCRVFHFPTVLDCCWSVLIRERLHLCTETRSG
jgi:hypothetical protein